MNKLKLAAEYIFNSVNHLISPNYCLVCSDIIHKENHKYYFLCSKCYDAMPVTSNISELSARISVSALGGEDAVYKAYALMNLKDNKKYMNLVHYLKYNSIRKIGYHLGKDLGKFLIQSNAVDFDLIIPVPIHHAKKRERGYNQSDYIAKGVSEILDTAYDCKAAKRIKYTTTQTKLSKDARNKNVMNIFQVQVPEKIQNKSILIVDDVLTTGSTINSLAAELMERGAKVVSAASIASA